MKRHVLRASTICLSQAALVDKSPLPELRQRWLAPGAHGAKSTRFTYLEGIHFDSAIKRCASAISDDGVEPTVLVATRFECEMYIGSMARLADHDARSISGLQHVDGVRAESALGIGEAPIQAAHNLA